MSAALSEDRIARLRLIRSANIGPVTYFQLLQRFGSAEAALRAVPDLAARGRGQPPRIANRAEIEREIVQVDQLGARYLFLGQGLYPPALGEIETAPPVLIVRGHEMLMDKPMVALVGARNASAAACRFRQPSASRRQTPTRSAIPTAIPTACRSRSASRCWARSLTERPSHWRSRSA